MDLEFVFRSSNVNFTQLLFVVQRYPNIQFVNCNDELEWTKMLRKFHTLVNGQLSRINWCGANTARKMSRFFEVKTARECQIVLAMVAENIMYLLKHPNTIRQFVTYRLAPIQHGCSKLSCELLQVIMDYSVEQHQLPQWLLQSIEMQNIRDCRRCILLWNNLGELVECVLKTTMNGEFASKFDEALKQRGIVEWLLNWTKWLVL